jgi:hypothetical protein
MSSPGGIDRRTFCVQVSLFDDEPAINYMEMEMIDLKQLITPLFPVWMAWQDVWGQMSWN